MNYEYSVGATGRGNPCGCPSIGSGVNPAPTGYQSFVSAVLSGVGSGENPDPTAHDRDCLLRTIPNPFSLFLWFVRTHAD